MDCGEQQILADWLTKKNYRTCFQGLTFKLLVAEGGDNDHRELMISFIEPSLQLKPRHSVQFHIGYQTPDTVHLREV